MKLLLPILMLQSLCFQTHPGGLLFTKFGSNQTALLDLAFPVQSSTLLGNIIYVLFPRDMFFVIVYNGIFCLLNYVTKVSLVHLYGGVILSHFPFALTTNTLHLVSLNISLNQYLLIT